MFDEEQRDEHGECRFEIDRLTTRVRELERALESYMDAVRYAEKEALIAAIRAADNEALRLLPHRVPPEEVKS